MIQSIKSVIALIILFISSAVGIFLVPKYAPVFIIISALLSVLTVISTYLTNKNFEDLLNTQAKQLIKSDAGNSYLIQAKKEYRKYGSLKKMKDKLEKALRVEPNNEEALAFYGFFKIINLYKRNLFLERRLKIKKIHFELDVLKKICKKGKVINKKNPLFYEIAGMVNDFEENHKDAQKEFNQSGKYRTDYNWHLRIGTSYMMSREYKKALHHFRIAELNNVNIYDLDFKIGLILFLFGELNKSKFYLLKSLRKNPLSVETNYISSVVFEADGNFFLSISFQLATINSMIVNRVRIKVLASFLIFTLFKVMSQLFLYIPFELIWKLSNHSKMIRKFALRFTLPDLLDVLSANKFLQEKETRAAFFFYKRAINRVKSRENTHNSIGVCLYYLGFKKLALQEIEKALVSTADEKKFDTYLQNLKSIQSGSGKIGVFIW